MQRLQHLKRRARVSDRAKNECRSGREIWPAGFFEIFVGAQATPAREEPCKSLAKTPSRSLESPRARCTTTEPGQQTGKAQKRQPKRITMAQLMERTQTERPRVVVVRRGMPPRRSTPHRDRALQELDALLNATDREAFLEQTQKLTTSCVAAAQERLKPPEPKASKLPPPPPSVVEAVSPLPLASVAPALSKRPSASITPLGPDVAALPPKA